MKKNLLLSGLSLLLGWVVTLSTLAQTNAVTGKITSMAGEAIPGVNVLVKGTNTGTTTDANGVYKINAVSNASILTFSAIGFALQEIKVGNRSTIDVLMQEDTKF